MLINNKVEEYFIPLIREIIMEMVSNVKKENSVSYERGEFRVIKVPFLDEIDEIDEIEGNYEDKFEQQQEKTVNYRVTELNKKKLQQKEKWIKK